MPSVGRCAPVPPNAAPGRQASATSEFQPKEARDELALAHRESRRRPAGMRVRVVGEDVMILRHGQGGFALDAKEAPGLRRLVDLHEGARLVCQPLIGASSGAVGERVFEVKRETTAAGTVPAADFVRDRPEPAGPLTRR